MKDMMPYLNIPSFFRITFQNCLDAHHSLKPMSEINANQLAMANFTLLSVFLDWKPIV